jgi:PRA1 family protein
MVLSSGSDDDLPSSSGSTMNHPNTSSSSLPPPLHMDITIESIRLQVGTLFARMKSHISIETIRPLPIFLGLRSISSSTASDHDDSGSSGGMSGVQISPNAFTTAPIFGRGTNRYTAIRSRVQENMTYFMSNYAVVAAMTAVVILLMHPSVLIIIAILNGLWWCHGYLIRHELIVLSIPIHTVLTVQQRFYLLFATSFILIIITCVVPTLIFLLITGVMIVCHAALRDTGHLHDASSSQRGVRGTSVEPTDDKNDHEIDPLLSSP